MSDAVVAESEPSPPKPEEESGPVHRRDHPHSPRRSAATVKSHAAKEGGPPREGGSDKHGVRLIGVRIPATGMVYRFESSLKEIKTGDAVLLHGKEEEAVGWVVFMVEGKSGESFKERVFVGGFDKIIRALSESELKFLNAREGLERKATIICREKIRELELPMRLSKVHYLPGGGKVVVYFTAENRVDFRELVRLLGSQLKVRVEMRHIGVRDETKLLGGMGLCGNELCCSSYLTRFHPVSVRMAKNQELSLNPEGISGTCGRLLCCLDYENATYHALRESLPKIKHTVKTLDGREGVVQAVHPLMGRLDVQLTDGSRACIAQCDLCECGGGRGGDRTEEMLDAADEILLEAEEAVSGSSPQARAVKSTPGPKTHPVTNSGRRPEKRRENAREPTHAGGAVLPAVEAAGRDSVRPEEGSQPLAEGSTPAPARKRRRRRRSSSTTEKKSTP
ncbi:MAG: hypothetical protein HQL80_04300 [Magnetococcales bacterium]|nr:hypothetical protein [Magnetococcales bacterium]